LVGKLFIDVLIHQGCLANTVIECECHDGNQNKALTYPLSPRMITFAMR